MPTPRKSPGLRAVAGERKSGATRKRTARATTSKPKPEWPDPGELAPPVRTVFDRMAPSMHGRGTLTAENVRLLVRWCELEVFADGAAKHVFDTRGNAVPLVQGDRGMVKNPAVQVWRDAIAQMERLAKLLHLDELGLGEAPDAGDQDDDLLTG